MKIRYFAWVKDITNQEEEIINIKELDNLEKLKNFLIKKYPNLAKHLKDEILRFAVNHEYIIDNIELNSNDEIAVFPPVCGG